MTACIRTLALPVLFLAILGCGCGPVRPESTSATQAAALARADLPHAWYAYDLRQNGSVTVMNILLGDSPDLCSHFAERDQHAHARLTLWPQGPRLPNGGKIPSSRVQVGRYPLQAQAQTEDPGWFTGTLHDGLGHAQAVAQGTVDMTAVNPDEHAVRGSFDLRAAGTRVQGNQALSFCAAVNAAGN